MKRLGILASSLFITTSALAHNMPDAVNNYNGYDMLTGWYIGIGVNGDAESVMDMNSSPDVFNGSLAASDKVKLTNYDAGIDVFVGKSSSDHYGIEFGFSYIGNVEFRSKNAQGVRTDKIMIEQWNLRLEAFGKWPIGEYVEVRPHLGVAYMDAVQEFKGISTSAKQVDRYHTAGITYGIGLEGSWHQFGLRMDYRKFHVPNNIRDDFYVSDVLSLNYVYTFI